MANQIGQLLLYGDSISGNCHKVRFVADYLGVGYKWIETSVLKKDTRAPAFLTLNPAGQVPIVQFPDGGVLSESNAIMRYLAEGSDLIPGSRYERAVMDQWLFWEQYSHESAIAVRRFMLTFLKMPEDKIDPALKKKGERALSIMEKHLENQLFFVAETLTLADVALVAYTRMAHEGGYELGQWPEVSAWVKRVETGLKIGPYGT
ncbi:MAG TPA: glutathione S-transferase family protein [Magnetospirillaceae bacterium]|jgi:glutathione S-transferase